MKYLFLFLSICTFKTIHGQSTILSCGSNGILSVVDKDRCCKKDIKNIGVFSDIAITPSMSIFLIDTILNKIDINGNIIYSIEMKDSNENSILGVGLLALNDDYLLMDKQDSLFKVDVNTGFSTNLGYSGYFCSGDFEKINDKYYMVTTTNELICFHLDPNDFSVENSNIIGIINSQNNVYSLFTSTDVLYQTKSLFCLISDTIYEINTSNASLNFTCKIENHFSYGAAIYSNSIETNTVTHPNIITPNNDGINDYILFNQEELKKLQIINRWGNIVFESNDFPCLFYGKTNNGDNITEGVYYYVIEDSFCESTLQKRVYQLTIQR